MTCFRTTTMSAMGSNMLGALGRCNAYLGATARSCNLCRERLYAVPMARRAIFRCRSPHRRVWKYAQLVRQNCIGGELGPKYRAAPDRNGFMPFPTVGRYQQVIVKSAAERFSEEVPTAYQPKGLIYRVAVAGPALLTSVTPYELARLRKTSAGFTGSVHDGWQGSSTCLVHHMLRQIRRRA